MTTQEQTARNMLNKHTTEGLIQLFEETNNNRVTEDVAMVRGWIMDVLEARDVEKFDAWLDSIQDSPRAFFL